MNTLDMESPVVVGGTGGSGTRCIAAIFIEAGGYLGWQLNKSYDSLSLTPFLRRNMRDAYEHYQNLTGSQVERWKTDFEPFLADHLLKYRREKFWGWKNPTTMYLVPFLNQLFPELKFIHLVRDGRDMATSTNSNQFLAFNRGSNHRDTERKAAFWSISNSKVKEYSQRYLKDHYLLLRFEDLCNTPEAQVGRILKFIGSPASIKTCIAKVQRIATIGRFHSLPIWKIRRIETAAKDGLVAFGYV